MKTIAGIKSNKPLKWVPTVYTFMGIPFGFVVLLSVIMYKKLGVSNTDIAFYTGLFTLPWALKPIWAAFIETYKTKRWWIYMTEFAVACFFFLIAFSLFSNMYFILSAAMFFMCALFASAHDISGDGLYIISLSHEEQALYIGFCGVCYNVGKIISSGLLVIIAGYLMNYVHPKVAWSIAISLGGGLFVIGAIYHSIFLPKSEEKQVIEETAKGKFKQLLDVYLTFFKIPNLWVGIAFIFFFEIGESQVLKMAPLFLLDSVKEGGLGLTTEFVGLAYGLVASVAIMIAGMVGGYFIYKKGLKYFILPSFLAINLPQIIYITLAYTQVQNHALVLCLIALEQFGYGFAYTTFLLYLRFLVKDSNYKTSHYAFFNSVIILSMSIPSMASGWLQGILGYQYFFIFVLMLMLPGLWVIKYLNIEPLFGKQTQE